MKFTSILLQFKLYPKLWNQPARFRHFKLPFNDKLNGFDNSLHQIIHHVKSEKNYLNNLPNFETKILKAAGYNPSGENNRIGHTMLTAYNMIRESTSGESDHQAFVLAGAAQMTDSYNKILNNAENYQENVSGKNDFQGSENNFKDADLLRSFIYAMIEHTFQDSKMYPNLLQLYNKAFLFSPIGRHLEHSLRKHNNTCANMDTVQYEKLCDYKIAYPYFQLPLFLAMTLANKNNTDLLEVVGRLCSDMGMLHQIHENFNNCFGTEELIGTAGTDIQKGKCSWLAVTAMQRFTPRQRLVFEACYGSEEPAHIERVKLLYKQVELPRLFREKEVALCESVMQQAETLEKSGIPYKLFEGLLIAIRNR